MSHLNPGLISAYNSLTDKHLTGYFNNARIRRHLQKVGLITRSGRIVPDKEYKHKLIQRAHQRHVRECLAQAIFHKVLDMEPSSSRPNTAPGKMQRPVRLKPLNSNSATASLKRSSPRHKPRDRDSSNDTDQPLNYTLDRDGMKHLTTTDFSSTVSPYRLPVINNYVTPVPPLTKKKERGPRANGTLRGRKLRPTTAPTAATEPSSLQRTSAQSKVLVSMVYFGKSVHLSHDLMDLRDEVKVFQQHCGGENLCVYKGKLREGEVFQFVSRRHQGFPFSLTFFLNGLQVDRLSSCCEFKHRKGARLGGRHGHFGFCGVEGASPCYKCIIAMGLDKKPTPPQKRVKEELPTSKSPDAKETTYVDEDVETQSNAEPDTPREMETESNGKTTGQKKTKDDYEEDFEADDEGPVEDGDEVEENPSSATNGGEKETESRDENDINEEKSNSDSDDANMSKVKRSPSVSSGRTSSLSSSDNDNSEREIVEDTKEVTAADVPEESLQAEEVLTPAETKPEETEATESSDVTLPQAAAEDSGTQDSPMDGAEKSDLEMSEDTDKKDGTEGEQSGEDAKPEDKPQENEPERAKSMQEKLAEAILKESQCSSEPEFSDTSTEEDERASVKTQQDGQGAEMAEITLPQPSNTQDDVLDERVHDDVEMSQNIEETNAQEPHFHTEEEIQQIDEFQEKVESLDMEEKQTEEQSARTNEVEQPDKTEEVKTETEEGQEKVMDVDNTHEVNTESKEDKESLVQEPETHDEVLDTGNTETEDTDMEGEGTASQKENGTETGAVDTERQRDADDADQNIERRSDGQIDRDERDDLVDGAEDDRATGDMVQETDGKVDDGGSAGMVEDGEESSEDKAEEEATEKVEVEDRGEKLGTEEAEKPGDEDTQDGEKENEDSHNLNAEGKENEDSTEKGENSVNDEVGNRPNESEGGQDVRTEGNEKEDDEQNETEDAEQVRDKLSVELEEEGQEKPNSEEDVGGETKEVKDETMEDGAQKEEEDDAEEEDKTIDEMAEGTDGNLVENELETGEKLVEESEKEVTDVNKISENTLEAGDGKEKAQKLEVNSEDQNEESVSQEEQNEIGSRGAPNDETEASTKEEVDEPAGVNNDLLDSNIDAENGERQDVGLEEAEKVEEHLQEETQGKSEGETTGDRTEDVVDDNEKPETNEEEEKGDDNVQEIENKSDAELVPLERESELGDEHEDQASDNQKADKEDDKEEVDKESETSATTFIENVTSQITQEMVNKDTENDIVSAEEPESELKGTDNELRSGDAPEVMDGDPVEPLERKGNSVNNDGGSSVSHSLKSQPVENVKRGLKGPALSIDSEDLAIHSAALTKAVGVDLVSNWINIHQESRYFQTFIEPLEEEGLISEESEERLNGEVLKTTDTPTSTVIEGLDETATPVRKNLDENTESVVESLKSETKLEGIEADAHSNHSKDSIHTSTKEERVQEDGDTKGSLATWSRQSNDEQTNQKDTAGQETSMSDDVINLAATSEDIEERAPSDTEHQDVPSNVDLNAEESERSNQQNMTDETTHLSQTEEASNKETQESSEHNLQLEPVSQTECIEPQSPTITVITDLTIINKSENGSQDDTASVDFHSRQSDGTRNVDGNRKTKVIDDHFKQTLSSRDTLSTFSLDDSRFFGPAGYPRLTTAHTENSY
ncbi:glutamate-rich 3-like protein [Labeo rohita]|uniref:Glutamate-rich 3-like protein n=1 Tax=Labeo rohita TaxID=84645 RepID=A0A498NS23_LABRO|nr:glutamate-rich 3-like protein [Labeo rohita]